MERQGGTADVLRFGTFEADPRSGELHRNGRRVPLQEMPFQVLLALLERCGSVVTREELRDRIWPHTFVGFDHAIRTAVNKIRGALGDTAGNPRFVETVPRHGYRFIAPVVQVGVPKVAAGPPVLSPADQAYLQGSYALRRSIGGLLTGIQHFRECIARDPNHAPAHVGLALLYLQMAYGYGPLTPAEALAEARSAALRALELDATLAEAVACLAWVRTFGEWRWQAAEREFRAALQLNSASAEVHRLYAWHLSARGCFEQALSHAIRARDLDPDSLLSGYTVAATYWWSRQYAQVVAEVNQLVEIDPTFAGAHWLRGAAYTQLGAFDDAVAELELVNVLSGPQPSPWVVGHLAHACASGGRDTQARELLERLFALSRETYVSPFLFAYAYAPLGDAESAFEWLERAYAEKNPMLVFLRVDPGFDVLRSDPRFAALVARMGFTS